jgi:hypothetical protein
VDREALAWAGGLFEGEGCITVYRQRPPNIRNRSPRGHLLVQMKDEEIVRRFHRSVSLGTVRGPYTRHDGKPDLWVWRAGSFEEFQAVLAMLWPWLGSRRRARGREVLRILLREQLPKRRWVRDELGQIRLSVTGGDHQITETVPVR